jgi:hypothetical protein
MVRIFDLPPGGLVDGATAKEVNFDGSPVAEQIDGNIINPVPTENSQILRKEFINKQNDKERGVIDAGEDSNIMIKTEEESQRFATPTPDEPSGSNAGGMAISMRPKLAVHIMRAEIPLDVIEELNSHIDDVIIPARKDQSQGLVGQINRNELSAQWNFPHDDGSVGEQFSSILCRLGKDYVKHAINMNVETDIQTMWTIHSYEGDYNPMHDHGTRTFMGLSCILYLKVPPQIEALDNPSENFAGLNGASGAVDGFTYIQWGTNGMRDVNMLRPVTEEYIKPEVGTLILFPAWLRHGVMPFFGEGERRTFSANINITPDEKLEGANFNNLKHKGKV